MCKADQEKTRIIKQAGQFVAEVLNFFISALALLVSVVNFLLRRVSYYLTRLSVDKETLEIFDGKKNTDYRQKLYSLLDAESEPLVGHIREMIEQTKAGRLAVRHISQRHDYAVLRPNKKENIRRILNVYDTFPEDCLGKFYFSIEDAINNFHYSKE